MPSAIANVVETVAALRQSTPERIERLVHGNFARLIKDDPWLQDIQALLARRRVSGLASRLGSKPAVTNNCNVECRFSAFDFRAVYAAQFRTAYKLYNPGCKQ